MPIKKLKPDADHFGIDEDWQGNNAAFRCPIREQVFILSEIIHYGPDGKGYRRCPNCEKCIACAKVGRKSGGEASIEWPDYFKLGHYPISEKVDNFDEHGLVFFTTIIFQTTPGSMVEHIKMTAQEAKQKSETIRKISSTHEQVKPTPFLRCQGRHSVA